MRPRIAPLLAALASTCLAACGQSPSTPSTLLPERQASAHAPDEADARGETQRLEDLTEFLCDSGALEVVLTPVGRRIRVTVHLTNPLDVPLYELKIIIIDNPVTRSMRRRVVEPGGTVLWQTVVQGVEVDQVRVFAVRA